MAPQGASAQELEASVIAGFNSKLVDRANQLKANHSDVSPCINHNIELILRATQVSTWLWDSNAAFTLVLDNPTAFGFVDNTSYGNTGDFWG